MKKAFFAILILALCAPVVVYLLNDKEEELPLSEEADLQEIIESEEPGLSVSPGTVLQGDPVLVTVRGVADAGEIESLIFTGKRLGVFIHEGRPGALIGLDLRINPGTYPLILTLEDGTEVREDLVVGARTIAKVPLGIPEKLGGNTSESERELVSTLVQEGAIISAIPTDDEKLWEGAFRLPINPPVVVTDTYGYSRLTGASTISHKGTDYRAAVGTPIYAMNAGKVAFTRFLRNYGNTIVVDHGLGLHTIYMHLSEIGVEEGQMVQRGEALGKSGATGYTLGPHLHLTVRISGISIDPQKFMTLMGQ